MAPEIVDFHRTTTKGNPMKPLYKSLLIACAVFSFSSLSNAQERDHAKHAEHAFGRHTPEQIEAQREKRLAALHDKLNLRGTQETAWAEFVAATVPPAHPDFEARRAELANLNAPDRAQKMLDQLKLHEANLTKHVQALKTFYAQLSMEQQKIFDESFKAFMQHRLHHR
jgi:periplasmic protein CpxP/Spy